MQNNIKDLHQKSIKQASPLCPLIQHFFRFKSLNADIALCMHLTIGAKKQTNDKSNYRYRSN